MTDFYTRMTTTAANLLDKFKQGTVTYTPPVSAANPWEPVTDGTPVTLSAVASGVSKQYIDDLVLASDIQLTVKPFGQTPVADGNITIDGTAKQIVRIQQVPAAGDPIYWLIFVRG